MKIALLSDSFIPAPNGTSISVEILRRSLARVGHDVWIFAPQYRFLKIKEDKIVTMPGIFSFPDKYRPKVWPISHPKREVLKEAKFDIVHSHHFYSPFNYALDFAKSCECPHVATFYRLFPEYENKKASLSLSSPYQKSVRELEGFSNQTNSIIALSKKSKQYLQDLGVSVPIDVCPIGVFTKDYTSYPPQAIYDKFKIPKERKILLYVARLESDANLEFLLRAFKIIWKAYDDVQLLVVGGGSLEREFNELVLRQPFNDYVTVTGYLPKNQVNRIYGVAELFVYPKTLDPEPLVVLESLAAGTPVIATQGVGISDLLKHEQEGLISEYKVESFAKAAVEALRRDQLRLEFSMRARLRARDFRASNLIHNMIELYDSAISGKDKTKKMF